MDSLLDINNLSFNDSKITIILDDKGEPWFKGKDIGKILEYSNIHKYIQHVDDDDRKQLKEIGVPNLGTLSHNEKNTIYINESGLYSLILSSKKEEAKKFKKWVTSEVLPSIRKHGEYKLKKELESVTNNFQEQLSLKDEQLSLKDQQLSLKEEEVKQQIILNNKKDLELEESKKLNEDYKEYCNRIRHLEKKDVIYILTNDVDIKNNIFKLGKTRINYLKKRLSSYNTGASSPYYYVYYKEVFNGEQIEKRFNDLMYRYNIKVEDKPNKEMYQLYLPDFEFYLEKIIDSCDHVVDHLNQNHETVFFNSKNKKSIVTPLVFEEEIIKTIKVNKKVIKSQPFESLPGDEQINILRATINNLETNIKRTELEDKIKSNHNLVVNKKMPFWNLVKEITKENDRIRITFR